MEPSTVDLSKFSTGNEVERLEISKQLVKSLKDHGVARLVNCGIPEAVATAYLELAKALFALPLQLKERVAIKPGPAPQRGYGAQGSEALSNLRQGGQYNSAEPGEILDVREHFDVGPPGSQQFPNVWPDESLLPDFGNQITSYWTKFQEVSLWLLSAIELGLSLPQGTFKTLCHEPASELRFNHYPKILASTLSEGNKQRAFPHSDIGIITLLFQDNVGGLEIEDRARSVPGRIQFLPVAPAGENGQPDILLMVGDTLERWTNGDIKAVVHRVSHHTISKIKPHSDCPERYSGTFFAKPNFNGSVAPLPQFTRERKLAAYDEMTYLAYHQQQMGKIYAR